MKNMTAKQFMDKYSNEDKEREENGFNRKIKFTFQGYNALLVEGKDVFGCNVVFLYMNGMLQGSYDVYTIDEIHDFMTKNDTLIEDSYC